MKLGALPITLRQLQYACALAEELNFRRAAARCFVSQPSLSAQIAELERSLGTLLFERNKKKVLITPAGKTLIARARAILLSTEDLIYAAQHHSDPLAGTLKIGAIPTIAPYLLPDLDPVWRKAFPGLQLQWREDKTEILIQKLQEGHLDAALLALEADLGDVQTAIIEEDPFVVASALDHPLSQTQEDIGLEALQGEKVLLLDEGHCFRDQAMDLCAVVGVQEREFRATSLTTLTQMVAGGRGVTLLPQLAVEVENRRGTLHIRSFQGPQPSRTLALAWRKGSAMGPAMEKLAATARQRKLQRRMNAPST